MFNIGPQELLLILLVALIVVGPKRLPELSRTIGKGLRELRKAQDEVRKTIDLGLDETEPTSSKRGARTRSGGPEGPTDTSGAPTSAGGPDEGLQEEAEGASETESIARTLGRGLAEIRRSRQEIQRTFRIDLSDRPSRSERASGPAAQARPPAEPTAGTEAATQADTEPLDPPREAPDEPAPPDPGSAG